MPQRSPRRMSAARHDRAPMPEHDVREEGPDRSPRHPLEVRPVPSMTPPRDALPFSVVPGSSASRAYPRPQDTEVWKVRNATASTHLQHASPGIGAEPTMSSRPG